VFWVKNLKKCIYGGNGEGKAKDCRGGKVKGRERKGNKGKGRKRR